MEERKLREEDAALNRTLAELGKKVDEILHDELPSVPFGEKTFAQLREGQPHLELSNLKFKK